MMPASEERAAVYAARFAGPAQAGLAVSKRNF